MADNGGAVVNVSSVAGIKPAPGIGFYGASKAMLTHITQELAVELGPRIRVTRRRTCGGEDPVRGRALRSATETEVASAYPLKRLRGSRRRGRRGGVPALRGCGVGDRTGDRRRRRHHVDRRRIAMAEALLPSWLPRA